MFFNTAHKIIRNKWKFLLLPYRGIEKILLFIDIIVAYFINTVGYTAVQFAIHFTHSGLQIANPVIKAIDRYQTTKLAVTVLLSLVIHMVGFTLGLLIGCYTSVTDIMHARQRIKSKAAQSVYERSSK